VAVSERWSANLDPSHPDRRAEDAPDRREVIGVDALDATGRCISIAGYVDRIDGTTIVSEPIENSNRNVYYFDEVRKAWGLPTQDRLLETPVVARKVVRTLRRRIASGTADVRSNTRIGRNDPCPCGSGKKFKKCCLRK
jgi:hypothetical protein